MRTYHFEDLLREVLVDKLRLERQVAGGVDAVALVLGRLRRSLAHRQHVCNMRVNSQGGVQRSVTQGLTARRRAEVCNTRVNSQRGAQRSVTQGLTARQRTKMYVTEVCDTKVNSQGGA